MVDFVFYAEETMMGRADWQSKHVPRVFGGQSKLQSAFKSR